MRRTYICAIVCTLLRCTTPYQARGFRGGYEDYKVSNNVIYISYNGNAYTRRSTIIKYWHKRAMEVCGGPDKYEILSMNPYASTSEIGGDRTSYSGKVTHTGNSTRYYGTATTTGPTKVTKYGAEGYIRCTNGGRYVESSIKRVRSDATSQHLPDERYDDLVRPRKSFASDHSAKNTEIQKDNPLGAVGYKFGISKVDAEQVCADSGYTMEIKSRELSRCASVDNSVGIGGVVLLRFCADSLCQIGVAVKPKDELTQSWIEEYNALRKDLIDKYGQPSAQEDVIPDVCVSTYKACQQTNELSIYTIWKWPSGYAVKIGNNLTDEFIHIIYYNPEGLIQPKKVDANNERYKGL